MPRSPLSLAPLVSLLALSLTAGVASALQARTSMPPADSLEELAARATRAVVLIEAQTPSGSRSQGSGFLVDASGRILTNYHVIRNARSMRIKLASGDVYDVVSVLAADERRDLAVLQVAGFDLPSLPLGNSDSVRIGHPVVHIGSPHGLENTVTSGIVSGRRQEPEGFQLLQISAPASRGSSGGPVLSRAWEVIGIAASQMQVGQNLNFAVPINYARGLLTHLSGEPLAVLRPTATTPEETPAVPASRSNAVNDALAFDLEGFGGYVLEMEARSGEEWWRRTRVTYRVIETLGGSDPRIERYLESETSRRSGPFGSHQTVRRERNRTLVALDGLQPISTRGETLTWTGERWQRSEYDFNFDGYHVRGIISDTAGPVKEIDRELPPGILAREVRDLAFATLSTEPLEGRSVEIVTFDPRTGDVVRDRFDVGEEVRVRIAGESERAIRVNVASGLSNRVAYFRSARPRVLLRMEGGDEGETEEVTRVEVSSR